MEMLKGREGCFKIILTDRLLGVSEEIIAVTVISVSYTHLRAHETVLDLVCRLLLEKNTNEKACVARWPATREVF